LIDDSAEAKASKQPLTQPRRESALIRSKLLSAYAFLFSRKAFRLLNSGLFHASMRGLGMLNYENDVASGERCFLREYLSLLENPIVVDVGANEGDYTTAVLEANRGAKVYALEPHPHTFSRLQHRASTKSGVIVVNAACGKAPGELTLFDYAGSQGSSHASLYEGAIGTSTTNEASRYVVKVVDLDTFSMQNKISTIDLLKIDTEGHELEVLKGASKLLRENRIRAIQFEFNEMNLVSRVFFKDFYNLLPNHSFYRMVRDGLIELDPYSPIRCELFVFQNIVAFAKN
jgi:FkbM family methyltransferase